MPNVVFLAALLAAPPEPTRVSLTGQQPLSAATAVLSKLSGIPIDLTRADSDRPVAPRLNKVPFWQALDELAAASKHRVVITRRGERVELVPLTEQQTPTPVSVDGAFRVMARRVVARRDLESGSALTEIDLDAVWEPTFRAFLADTQPREATAAAPDGSPLTLVDASRTRTVTTGRTAEFKVRLIAVPRSIDRLESLTGQFALIGTDRVETVTVRPIERTPAIRKPGVSVEVRGFKKSGRAWLAEVRIELEQPAPPLESFEQAVWLDGVRATLTRSGEAREFAPTGMEVVSVTERVGLLVYEFEQLPGGEPKDWVLTVVAPSRVIEVPVRFKLGPVRLP